ncbi:unnamed protein product, partial [Porites lobata]
NKFYPGGPSAFMPVQRIFSRFASAEVDVEGQKQVVMAPINRKNTSLRQIYKVLSKKEDFHGFYLDEDIFQRVMAQVLHQHGGEERCP